MIALHFPSSNDITSLLAAMVAVLTAVGALIVQVKSIKDKMKSQDVLLGDVHKAVNSANATAAEKAAADLEAVKQRAAEDKVIAERIATLEAHAEGAMRAMTLAVDAGRVANRLSDEHAREIAALKAQLAIAAISPPVYPPGLGPAQPAQQPGPVDVHVTNSPEDRIPVSQAPGIVVVPVVDPALKPEHLRMDDDGAPPVT